MFSEEYKQCKIPIRKSYFAASPLLFFDGIRKFLVTLTCEGERVNGAVA